jgi:hypothetical protein
MGGDKFHPAASLTPEEARGLWASSHAVNPNEPARAFDPDLDDGTQRAKPKSNP